MRSEDGGKMGLIRTRVIVIKNSCHEKILRTIPPHFNLGRCMSVAQLHSGQRLGNWANDVFRHVVNANVCLDAPLPLR